MRCWKLGAQRQFDAWSQSYDQSILQRWFFGPSHDKLLSVSAMPTEGRVLDVGCGTGLFMHRLLAQFPQMSVVGLDLSEGMLDHARRRCQHFHERAQFQLGDSEHLPFPDHSFDVATCIHSFHHYPRQDRVIAEMYRVLKPEGKLWIVDANRDGWWGWMLFDGIVAAIERGVHHCSSRRFADLLSAQGFSEVAFSHGGCWAPFQVVGGRALKTQTSRQAA